MVKKDGYVEIPNRPGLGVELLTKRLSSVCLRSHGVVDEFPG